MGGLNLLTSIKSRFIYFGDRVPFLRHGHICWYQEYMEVSILMFTLVDTAIVHKYASFAAL